MLNIRFCHTGRWVGDIGDGGDVGGDGGGKDDCGSV
jgi:hypothetical protein